MEGYMELIDTLPSFTGADFDRLSRLSYLSLCVLDTCRIP